MNNFITKTKEMLGIGKGEAINDPGFYLLPDRPIDPDKTEDIRFGHDQLANTLFELLKNAKPPFTVGLYGKWGVGKTTVAYSVRKLANDNKFKCLFFDAWKYGSDSLRRQFLIELDKQVFDGRLNYKSSLNQTLSIPSNIKLRDYFRQSIKNVVVKITLALLVISLIAVVTKNLYGKDVNNLNTILTLIKDLSLIGFFVSYILSSFEFIKITTQQHRTDSAEGFEDHFNNALKEPELKNKKLLVIIDNLDRVENKLATSALSDIKTFLSQDGNTQQVLFLIPCDDQALRAQLSAIYGAEFDANEFLRKFFNLTIKIPKFIDIELSNYVHDLLVASNIIEFQSNKELEWVIVYALRDNPREIKQFVNSLIPQILLARSRKLEPVLGNPAFLAKLLVLRQKYPILYEILELESLRSQISLDTSEVVNLYKKELELQKWDENKIINETQRFELFNKNTRGINEDNIDVFLTLRRSDVEKEIPEWNSFLLSLEEGQSDNAEKIFTQIIHDNKVQVLDSLLWSYVEKHKTGPSLIILLTTILPITEKTNQILNNFFDAAANYFPFGQAFEKVYQQFNPSNVFNYWYIHTSKSKRVNITEPFVALLGISQNDQSSAIDTDYALSLFEVIKRNVKIFKPFDSSLGSYIENYFFKHPYLAVFDTDESKSAFITQNAGAKYVDSLTKEVFQNNSDLTEGLDCWRNLKLPDGAITNSIKKYRELLTSFENDNEDNKLTLCKGLFEFTKKYNKIIASEEVEQSLVDEISSLSVLLGNYYDQITERLQIIDLIDYYSKIETNPSKNVLENKIVNFITTSDNETILKVSKQKIKEWMSSYIQPILDRSQKDTKLLLERKIYEVLSPEQNQLIVLGLVNNGQNPEPVLSVINYKVQSPETVVDHITNSIPSIGPIIIPDIFKILRGLGIEKDSARIENLKTRLVEFKQQHPDQVVAIEKITKKNRGLFNPGQRRELFTEDEKQESE